MHGTLTPPAKPFDYEHATSSIIQKARRKASVAQPGTNIVITHGNDLESADEDMIRMLLTKKVRDCGHLRYQGTLFGVHSFLTT